jgi:alkylglycerol monooxygenase
LLCSIGGDWFLTWSKTRFIHGVGCFGVAMVAYIAAIGVTPFHYHPTAVAFAAYGLCFMLAISRKVTNSTLFCAVGVYITLICFMGWRATMLHQRLGSPTSLVVQVAALVFMVSDSCIAINRWLYKWPRANFFIMLTYYLAQALFATAVLWPTYNRNM